MMTPPAAFIASPTSAAFAPNTLFVRLSASQGSGGVINGVATGAADGQVPSGGLDRSGGAAEEAAAHAKFLAALAGGGGGGTQSVLTDDLVVEELAPGVAETLQGTPVPTAPGIQRLRASGPIKSPLGNSPGSLSLPFAESQRSALGKTFTFEEDREVVWTKMSTLGKGSFGTVYEGITADGKIMAVKVQEIPLDEDAEETKALEREINLMRSLKHKNIVTYYGCQTKINEEKGGTKQIEIYLELCHGGSLAQLRKKFERAKERFAISLVRAYTTQILEGLAYLHDRNVMHRDLKSDNVLISALGEAKLADFGCSKRLGGTHTLMYGGASSAASATGGTAQQPPLPSSHNRAMHQTLVGSPFFMAPEILLQDDASASTTGGGDDAQGANGEGGSSSAYSMAADIWSVGCLVLELLGREPWSFKNSSNVFQLMYQISQAKGMPTGVPQHCPPLIYRFFERCFERNPRKRATAAELLRHEWILCPDHLLEELPPDCP